MNWFDKNIKVGHYFYITILLVMVIIFLIAVDYWNIPSAGAVLNNIATVTSIVLAVLAIIITLVDVAGQRDSVHELKESVKNINVVLEDAEEINTKNLNELEKVLNFRNELFAKFEEMKVIQHRIGEKISSAEDTINKKDLEAILGDIKNFDNQKDINSIFNKDNTYVSMLNDLNDEYNHKKFRYLEKVISNIMVSGEEYTIEDISKKLLKENNSVNHIELYNTLSNMQYKRIILQKLEPGATEPKYFLNI